MSMPESKLDIIAYNDSAVFQRKTAEYRAWAAADRWKEYHADSFPYLTLPVGQEKETLRAILVDARLEQKLSFRFWWAGHNGAGKVGLFMSFKTIEDTDKFDDICEKHGVLEPVQP